MPVPDAVTVDLYWASLDVDEATAARCAETLSVVERDRVAQLGDVPEGHWRLAEFGIRRLLLAARAGCAPAQIAYAVSPDGKPSLADGPHFSASRAGGVALYAVCDDLEVGVDIEVVPDDVSDPAHERLARRLLSSDERAMYTAMSRAERPAALMACWTRKEAHGKARGTGLVFPLVEIEAWVGDGRRVGIGDVMVQGVDVSDAERARGMRGAPGARDARLAGAVAVVADAGRRVSVPVAPVRIDPTTLPG